MIDLHTHTTASDGLDSPTDLIDKALVRGIKALAITDHDTLSGLAEAEDAVKGRDIKLIRGVEIAISHPRGEFHLLALNLGYETTELEARLKKVQEKRVERNLIICHKMRHLSIPGSYDDIKKLGNDIIGRPHFAQHLVNVGEVKTIQSAFDKYLGYGRPLFEAKEAIELEEALELIRKSAGKAVIAHPLSLYLSWGKLPAQLRSIRERGVEGLEAYHSQCSIRESERLALLALDLGFFITGGSDYHGSKRADRQLGLACGGQPIADELLDSLFY